MPGGGRPPKGGVWGVSNEPAAPTATSPPASPTASSFTYGSSVEEDQFSSSPSAGVNFDALATARATADSMDAWNDAGATAGAAAGLLEAELQALSASTTHSSSEDKLDEGGRPEADAASGRKVVYGSGSESDFVEPAASGGAGGGAGAGAPASSLAQQLHSSATISSKVAAKSTWVYDEGDAFTQPLPSSLVTLKDCMPRSQPHEPAVRDEVLFKAVGPRSVVPGNAFRLSVWAFLREEVSVARSTPSTWCCLLLTFPVHPHIYRSEQCYSLPEHKETG